MMDRIEINECMDIYGPLLTKRQQEIMTLYYAEDLSYAEISEELSISRSAVMDTIHRAISLLEKYESVVQYNQKKHEIQDCCQKQDWERLNEIM